MTAIALCLFTAGCFGDAIVSRIAKALARIQNTNKEIQHGS